MSWCLGGDNCLNRGLHGLDRFRGFFMDGRGRCQNQDFQEKQQFVKWIQFQHGRSFISPFSHPTFIPNPVGAVSQPHRA